MLEPRRQGKSLAGLHTIRYCLAANKSLAIGTANVDALALQVKEMFPNAKLTKKDGYLLVEKEEWILDGTENLILVIGILKIILKLIYCW